jgi:xanthine dehydrogenase accessory factor
MHTFYRSAQEIIAEGLTVAVATIIHTAGSVPREVGAKMLIHPQGRHVGTIGGGCGEADVMRVALDVIEQRRATLTRVDLTGDVSLESDGICGGILDVLVEPWPPAEEDATEWRKQIEALATSEASGSPAAYLTCLPPGPVRHVLLQADGSRVGALPPEIAEDALRMVSERRTGLVTPGWFLEVQRSAPTLLIVGAGHVALPLARMAAMLDFRVAVLDDRPSFVNATRFPEADELIVDHFDRALREYPIDADTYVVLITRGHQHDVTSLMAVIDSPAGYIGMIGSRRRVKGVFELLEREEGIDPEKLRRVYSPIGLEIGAITPAEIAVAILAEVINVYRHGKAPTSSDYRRQQQGGGTSGD